MINQFDQFKHESLQSKNSLESKIELLENRLEYQKSETKEILQIIENEKLIRDKLMIERKETDSQTDYHPEIPYLVTDPLPPIFSSQLCFKSRPIHFLSRSLPNLSSILWCPSDNEAEEFLSEQYDREIQEFYLDAQEQARLKHGADQGEQVELQGVLDDHQCSQPGG